MIKNNKKTENLDIKVKYKRWSDLDIKIQDLQKVFNIATKSGLFKHLVNLQHWIIFKKVVEVKDEN